jgi:hypothetical protein
VRLRLLMMASSVTPRSCKIIIKKSERWRPETLMMPYEGF